MNGTERNDGGAPHLPLVEALGVVDEPDGVVRDRHLAELREAFRAERVGRPIAPVHPLRRRSRRVAAGVVGIAAALLAIVVLDAPTTNSNRADASTLDQLADRAGSAPAPDPSRPVLHVVYRTWADGEGGDGAEVGGKATTEAWRRSDGSGVEERRGATGPGATDRAVIPASQPDASTYAWDDDAQMCRLRRGGDAAILRTLQGRRVDTSLLASLPRDPDELAAALGDLQAPVGTEADPTSSASGDPTAPGTTVASTPDLSGGDPAASCTGFGGTWTPTDDQRDLLVIDAATMLLGPWSPPPLRAAAFEVLSDLSEVRTAETQDPLGRDAVAVTSVAGDGARSTTYVDPTTSEYLGLVIRDASGTRISEELVERSEWVPAVPA